MSRATTIRSIVFDVGQVFLRLRPRPILELLDRHGVAVNDLSSLIARIRLDDHECGRLNGRGLLANLSGLFADPPHADEVHAYWNDMFDHQAEMIALAHRLADRYRVFVLSNVGDLHWIHVSREFGIHRIGHGALPSFVAGVMKPDPAIYAAAEARFALDPATTVFIDDRPENIAACERRGWHGIVHTQFATTRLALQQLDIQT